MHSINIAKQKQKTLENTWVDAVCISLSVVMMVFWVWSFISYHPRLQPDSFKNIRKLVVIMTLYMVIQCFQLASLFPKNEMESINMTNITYF